MRKITIGNALSISMERIASSRHKKFGYGGIMISLGETPVWFSGDIENPAPVKWNWIGLLSFLVSNWPWIFSEQNIPFAVMSQSIPTYWFNKFSKIKNEIFRTQEYSTVEESELKAFCARHDLAESVPGIDMPPLFILRSGKECIVASGETQIIVKLDDMHTMLSQVGNEIASWIGDAVYAGNKSTIESWNIRDSIMRSEINKKIYLLANMSQETMNFLSEGKSDFWEIEWNNGIFSEGAIFAAARMTSGYTTREHQKIILDVVKNAPLIQSPALESATCKINWSHWGSSPFKQGYYIAEKFRGYLGVSSITPVDPEEILISWGIQIQELQLTNSPVEAVACWGKLHGPLIILNTAEGKKSRHSYGKKFTLGHELCHLLVDRGSTLDVCEVLGGNTLALFEKRANAFTAELLFPKNLARELIRECSGDVSSDIEAWRIRFNITRENIAAQILNHYENRNSITQPEIDFLMNLLRGDSIYTDEE